MDQRCRSARTAVAAVVALGLGLLLVVSPASAEVDGVELGLLPVGQSGPFFDVVMRPGESRLLEVEIANHGSAAITASTYAADVYTIINGGFGGRLRDEPATGTTLWLDYESGRLDLAIGHRSTRAFTITVPADAGPGEYITSLILENEDPVEHDGAVAARQVVRQALGVVVTVPGRRSPEIQVGAATHTVVAGRSVLSVAVSNPGNVRLRPMVEVSLRDAGDHPVSHASVQMDTFYAVTDASVEVPLDALLLPGSYTIKLVIDDADQGVSSIEERAFTVQAAASPDRAPGGVPGLTEVDQNESGSLPWQVVALVVGVGVVTTGWMLRRRARPGQHATR